MAKLCSPYVLCPVVANQGQLFGLESDLEQGCVLATLGTKMVIRYKLEDQKPLGSWSSRDALTSQVVVDRNQKQYVGVFGQNMLRVWNTTHDNLNSIKKHKFELPIHCLLSPADGDPPVVVFQNGQIMLLNEALENRRNIEEASVLEPKEKILHCNIFEFNMRKYVALVTTSENGIGRFHLLSVSNSEKLVSLIVYRHRKTLLGHTVTSSGCLMMLWSDGALYSFPLFAQTDDVSFPGKRLNYINCFSMKHSVRIISLNPNLLAMYGADVQEEGGQVILYNVRYNFIVSQKHFKSFSKPPMMWNVESSLGIIVGSNVVIIPYCLELERLSAVLGSQKVSITQSEDPDIQISTEPETAVWSKKSKYMLESTEDIAARLGGWNVVGMPESVILEEISPRLIENKNIKTLLWCMNRFGDISEKVIVLIVEFCVNELELSPKQENKELEELLHTVLNSSFDEVSLVSYLRGLPFSSALKILHYLINVQERELQMESDAVLSIYPEQILKWTVVLLDAFYQHFILSRDPNMLQMFQKLQNIVIMQMEDIKLLKTLSPLLQRLLQNKPITTKPRRGSHFYSIERVTLY